MVLAVQGVMDTTSSTRRGQSVVCAHTPVPKRALAMLTSVKPHCTFVGRGVTLHRSARMLSQNVRIVKSSSTQATAKSMPAASMDTYTGMALLQGKREDMEDYAVVVPSDKGYVFGGVFDGHGGAMAAKYLSENLAGRLADRIAKDGMQNLGKTVTTLFSDFDDELLDYLDEKGGEEWQCGSTATVALVFPDNAVIANVGDSRAVLAKKSGKAVELTSEHRPYGGSKVSNREVERIKSAGGWVNDGRVLGILAVSRAFGDFEFKRGLDELLVAGVMDKSWTKKFAKTVNFAAAPVVATPDVLEHKFEADDEYLIVASDGLWEVTTSAQAVRFIRRAVAKTGATAAGLEAAAKQLVDDAVLRRRTSDNVSCIIFALPGSGAVGSSSTPATEAAVKSAPTPPVKKAESPTPAVSASSELPTDSNPVLIAAAAAAVAALAVVASQLLR
uniref:PPM-type phosphatase domain-containing protein n=1 Tax=Pyramimonas obovata TaxID=1411642 RepID=A0A7S0R6Q1_9CHLO|mmetsp:Transcript_26951/g.58823  ORF Transcript_26951/g.58823 Transcript_26951/m.58823 type:complete len:445 (+) Transcript_26951:115-1449(+)